MRVHLIDGTYELFRSHFGAPPRRAPDGSEVGATVGLVASLRALQRDPAVTHAAVAFDHCIESFRNRLYPEYKSSAGVPAELLAQFPLAEEAARTLGLVVWPMVELEADDALATAAAWLTKEPTVEQVVLCSPDKDLAQCVESDRIVCLDRRRQLLLDESGVRDKFGVSPASMPDWLALVGDSADGYPGVPRWGAKSAAAVLSRYPHLEEIPPTPNRWQVPVRGAQALAGSLLAHREDAFLFRTLATLRLDAPLTEGLHELEWHEPSRDSLRVLARRLGIELA